MTHRAWLEDFAHPPRMFRPIPFWSWNGRMDPQEVRRQVDLMADAGLGGFMMHSRIGLLTPYLGEEWFQAVDAAVDQAKKHGMKVWIYDEDKWPSGTCGGKVVWDHPEYRMKALVARPVNVPPPADCTPLGQPQHDLQIYVWQAPLGHEHFNGACYASLMNRQAMQTFLDLSYEPYYERLKQDYGQTVVGHFYDEPATIFRHGIVHGALPFEWELLDAFEQMFGYDPRPHLVKLFHEVDGFAAFRLHYYRVVNRLFELNFSKLLGDWCRKHGVQMTGHYIYEQGLYEQQLWGVRIMPHYRHMDVPGIDHLCLQISERVTAIQCRSIVNQYGKSRMLSELYGAAGQDLTFEDRKWIGDQQICLGVNLFNPHLSLYTMSGCRKQDFPPNLFYQQPWWSQNAAVDDYVSRLCVALSKGQYASEMVILHPQESIAALWTPRLDPKQFTKRVERDYDCVDEPRKREIDALNNAFKGLTDLLLSHQRQFDYADEEVLEEIGQVERQNDVPVLRIGQMTYPLLILPPMETIRPHTLSLITRFVDAGGHVVSVSRFPKWVDGNPHPDLERLRNRITSVDALDEVPAMLKQMRTPSVEVLIGNAETNKSLWIHRRQGEGYELLFAVNTSRRLHNQVTLRWRNTASYSISSLNPQNGDRTILETKVDGQDRLLTVEFSPAESHLLLAEPSPSGPTIAGRADEEIGTPSSPIAHWQIRRQDDNALPLDRAYYRLGSGPWSAQPVPLVAIQEFLNGSRYDGPVTLRFGFDNRMTDRRKVHLVVENIDQWQVTVNGRSVRYRGLPCWIDNSWLPVDIGEMVVPGTNTIECHCPNFRHGNLKSYADQARRYGTEIDLIYLVGDFSVMGRIVAEQPVSPLWDQNGLPPASVRSLRGPFTICDPQPLTVGDVTVQGLPFYAGRLSCQCEISDHSPGILRMDRLEAVVASVAIDGTSVGTIAWAPYSLVLPNKGHILSVTLYNSLRNLLGPHHWPTGLLPYACPGNFTADPYNVRDPDGSDSAWMYAMEKNDRPVFWSENHLLRQFGLIGTCWVEDR